ncbi:MAG: hypothetical protein H7Y14_00205 [Burkholderiales bacterium]|nr:hypothetical protein [Burkholderiales bacterium]
MLPPALLLGTPLRAGVTAALFMVFGSWWAYEGVQRGQWLGRVDPAKPLTLVAERKEMIMRLFKEHFAEGRILETGEPARVGIFATQFDKLLAGGKLEVYRLAPGAPDFVFKRKYEESLPLIPIGPLRVSWHFPAGVFVLVVSFALGIAAARGWRYNP